MNAVGFPYKGASTSINGEQFKVWEAEAIEDLKIENRAPGKVFLIRDGLPIVVCGSGLLRIKHMTSAAGRSVLPFKAVRVRLK